MTDPKRFASRYPFALDDFQVEAIDALATGGSVLVAAPTGSGKTVVAEYAIERALDLEGKCFYTTPLKALSNQKFGDLVARHGAPKVGLLTGDNSINGEAPVVVMTTEVLRNMLYERSDTIDGLVSVVMDEVHYLQDPYRGAVWEEVLIHLPMSVSVVCLSATISNAEEFGEWIGTLRGTTRVVIEEKRPVPLEHHYLVGRELHPMHVEQDGELTPNPYIVSLDREEVRYKTYFRRGSGAPQHHRTPRPREGHRRFYVPKREDVVDVLADQGMLPAIYFVFSRAGCDRSVEWLMNAGIRLTTREEAQRIREFAEMRVAWMDEDDLKTLGFYEFQEALAAGISAHHAGMLPVFKETVEELFEAGLVKVVFATETLCLGINMPAKSVVIEDLWKFQGERHELLTPGEYTQLTGRAGRRGIDRLGHAIVVYQRKVPFERVASLASTRTYELSSSFRPSYNMAVNLIRNYSREEAHHLLNSSFAQFLADRGVVVLERQLERDKAFLDGYREQMRCHLGDFEEYWRAAREGRADPRGVEEGPRPSTDRRGPRGPGEPSGGRRHLRPSGETARAGRGALQQRGEADRPRPGPQALPRLGPRLPGTAGRDDADPTAALGECEERPFPARPRGTPGRPRRPPTAGLARRGRPGGRARGDQAGAPGRAAPLPRVSRPARSRALGETRRRAGAPAPRDRPQDPDPNGNTRSPVRARAFGAAGARVRRGVLDPAEGTDAREDLRGGRRARRGAPGRRAAVRAHPVRGGGARLVDRLREPRARAS